MIPLIVSVDTEEDNWRSVSEGVSVNNIRELPRLMDFFGRLGIRPTFFVTYQVATRPWAAAILRDIAAGSMAEIATHVHPWNTPPFRDGATPRATMLCNYPGAHQSAKIHTVTEVIADATGARPTSFRAGRFGLGRETVSALVENGYTVDSSVTPFHTWAAHDHGPDFRGAPTGLYRLDGRGDVCVPVPDGPLIEVPISAGFTRFAATRWTAIDAFSRTVGARGLHLPGIAARTGLVRRTLLSPEVSEAGHMLAVSRLLLAAGTSHVQLFFHSSSLRPGLNPLVPSRAALDRLRARIESYLDGLSKLSAIEFHTVGEVGTSGGPRRSAPPATAHQGPERISTGHPTAADADGTRRLLLICRDFGRDGAVGAVRWAGFCKYLVRRGWEVHVLADAVPEAGELWEGVQRHPGGNRLLGIAREARRLVRRFRPDLVVTSGPPHSTHVAGYLSTLRTGTPLALDLHAPWWDESVRRRRGFRGSVLGQQLARTLEDRLFRRANRVFAASSELADALQELHPASRVAPVRSGVDLEELPAHAPSGPGTLTVTCAGSPPCGETMDLVRTALRIFFDRTPEAVTSTRILQLERPAAAPRAEIRGALAGSHLVVLCVPDQDLKIPLELYESLGMGLPTLVCAPPENATAREGRRLGALVKQPEDIAGIAAIFEDAWRGALPRDTAPSEPLDCEHLAGVLELRVTGTGAPPAKVERAADGGTVVLEGRPKANWYWLADLARQESALELTVGQPALAPALRLWFSDVTELDCAAAFHAGPHAATTVPRDPSALLPYQDGTFDLVAIHDTWADLVRLIGQTYARPDLTLLTECRRVLRAGGCLYVAGANPGYRRVFVRVPLRQRSAESLAAGAMRSRLASIGFSRLQSYYLSPSHALPQSIIPATRRAVSRYERVTSGAPMAELLRRGLSAVGLHHTLFPSVGHLAYR